MSIARCEQILAALPSDAGVAGIEDLIAMKVQAGRPQDLRDTEELRRIQRLQESRAP